MASTSRLDRQSRVLAPAAVGLSAVAAYWPSINSGLFFYDDGKMFVSNEAIKSFSWAHLKAIFFSFDVGVGGAYVPLTWLTHMVDFSLWGDRWAFHHVTSLLLHGVNAVLAYFLVLRLLELAAPAAKSGPARLAAAAAAILYGAHPLRVEVVAWLSPRNYIVPMTFYLLSALAYLRAHRERFSPRWLATSWLLYVLSLMAKAIGITLPVVLLALDAWPLRRFREGWDSKAARAAVLEKLPYLAAGLLMFLVSLKGRADAGRMVGFSQVGLIPRLGQLFFESTLFVDKTLLPFGVTAFYENRNPANMDPFSVFLGARTALFALITALAAGCRRRWPIGAVAWFGYLIALLPLTGLFKYDNPAGIGEDKFSYLASIWLSVLAGWLVLSLLERGRGAALAAVCLAAGFFAVKTWRQTALWSDPERWWTYCLAVNPDCFNCRESLVMLRVSQGRYQDAVDMAEDALRVWPQNTFPSVLLGYYTAAAAIGKADRALARIQELAGRDRGDHLLHYNLGVFYGQSGRLDEALRETRISLESDPLDWKAHENMSFFLTRRGDHRDAGVEHQEALRLQAAGYVNRYGS